MNKLISLKTLFLIFIILSWLVCGYAALLPKEFLFNRKDSLKEWKEKVFHGRVLYEIKPDTGEFGYLQALSEKSSSGLFYKISFNPRKNPYIRWKWRADKFPSLSIKDGSSKKGWIERDDYVLRVYIIFPSIIFTNTECLEYVWSEDLPKGTVLTSPFFKNIKLIVVESGKENSGQWLTVERDIAKDYQLAFKRHLKRSVGAIALMTDADNTKSSALGYYADIKAGYVKSDQASLEGAFVGGGKWGEGLISRFLEYVINLFRFRGINSGGEDGK